MVPPRFSVLLVALAVFGSGEGIRLCGPRLADLLNIVCEKLGGFHAPKRDVSVTKRLVSEILPSQLRRSDTGDMMEPRGGVVDECCRKQCSMATLVSYCANSGNIDLDEILPTSSKSAFSTEDMAEYRQLQQESESESAESARPHFAHSSRPNLGQFNRNRPVFMVLSQLQDEDQSL